MFKSHRSFLLIALFLTFPLHANFSKWEKDIAKFETADKKSAPPKNAYLFIGSSSVRLWNLKKSFPEIATINRGFGGSQLSDSVHFADRIVLPYQPKAVFLYAGDNDINKGKTVNTVVADYQRFVKKIHTTLPETDIIFLPIKPSIKRWNLWPKMNKTNLAIQKIASINPKLHYLDIPAAMLKTGEPPAANLFKKDELHMSPKGYSLWTQVVQDWLKSP